MTQILSDSEFIISDVTATHNTPNFFNQSINLIGNAKSRGLHQLEISLKVTLANEADIRKFQAFMLKVRGRLNPFKLSLLDDTDGKGFNNPFYYNSNPMLTNDISIGNSTMILSGISGSIPAGTMFQFSNDTKVYTLLDNAMNNKVVEFFPATRQPHQLKERLNLSVEPLVRLEDDSFKLKYSNTESITLKLWETL